MGHRNPAKATVADAETVTASPRHGPASRIAVVLLAVAFLLVPAVLATAHHPHPLPPFTRAAAKSCLENSAPDSTLCICAAVEQASLRLPVAPLVLFMVSVLAGIIRRSPIFMFRGDCGWRLDRCRAFLQVFLI